jgi:hypothetical protein
VLQPSHLTSFHSQVDFAGGAKLSNEKAQPVETWLNVQRATKKRTRHVWSILVGEFALSPILEATFAILSDFLSASQLIPYPYY